LIEPKEKTTRAIGSWYWCYHYLKPPEGKRLSFSFATFDWLWSRSISGESTRLTEEYRWWTKSGEKLPIAWVLSRTQRPGARPKWGMYQRLLPRFTINSPKKLVGLYGRECSLLRNEDMLPETASINKTVYSISSTILLVLTAHLTLTYSVVTNCNDNKGMKRVYATMGRALMRFLAWDAPETRDTDIHALLGKCKSGLLSLKRNTPTVWMWWKELVERYWINSPCKSQIRPSQWWVWLQHVYPTFKEGTSFFTLQDSQSNSCLSL
jgi:hypothetical protein